MNKFMNFRVDVFNGCDHIIRYFDTLYDAIHYANDVRSPYCFILEHVCDGKYDLVRKLEREC